MDIYNEWWRIDGQKRYSIGPTIVDNEEERMERDSWGKNEANENMMNKGFRNEKCKIEEIVREDRFLLLYRYFYSSIAFVI